VSEDCLRLNVYTSEVPRDSPAKLKPVFAWIHSGGLLGGSSISIAAGGEYLLDRDVVLVTINYRIASLGFMSTGTKDAPGNNGFKDQSIALRWIHDHIENFSGDPNSVTLMGQSAGARSVMLHLVSPMSQGLFHRAILMSGGVTGQWEVPPHQIHLAKQQARILSCPEEDTEAMVECLRKIDGETIGNTTNDFKEFDGKPIVIWYPVVEPDFGQERFLTDDPKVSFASGNFSKVPIITGITQDEFVGASPGVINNPENLRLMNEEFEKYAPICFMYERDTQRSREISRALWDNFIGTEKISIDSFDGLAYLFNDGIVGFTVHRFVQLIHKYTKVYYYKNTFVGRHSNFFYPPGSDKPYGELKFK
jgi:acetylcholinesterase